MRLIPEEFNEFLVDIGQRVAWRRSYVCPCLSPHSGAADPNCPDCSGKGRVWRAPLNCYAGVTSMHGKRQYAQFGIFEAGDLLLTLPSDTPIYEMGAQDIVLLLDATQPFSVVLTSGENDAILFAPARIDRVWWRDGSGVFESPVRAVNGREMDWSGHVAPPPGTRYSVTGRWLPDYVCLMELPAERSMHMGAALPRRVVVRRFDLFGR